MKQIIFKKLSIKNFLSVGPEPVVIDFEPGLHIITGINKDKLDRRNGVGKSTIADALYFVLYGNTIRELKKEFICNNITSGVCEVSLDLTVSENGQSDNFKITRLLTPSKCYIYKNDIDITRDSITNSTDYINDLICTSEDVFQNCVIMTLNNTVPFMGKKKLDKRKFIEGILNLEVFSCMTNLLRNDYNEIRRNLETECILNDELDNNLTTYKDQKKINEINKTKKEKKYQTRYEDNAIELEKINSQLINLNNVSLEDSENNIKILNEKLIECDNKIVIVNKKISSLKTQVDILNKQKLKLASAEAVCPTCLKEITKDDREHLEEEKIKIDKKIINLESEHKEVLTKLDKINHAKIIINEKINNNNNLINSIKIKQQNIKNLKHRKNQLTNWQLELKQDLQELESYTDQFSTIIKDTETRLAKVKKSILDIKEKIKYLDVVKFIVSEEGVKSYIVKKILQLLNNKLSYYLKKMDSNCVMFFNEYFEEQIVDDKGKLCSYFNFSGAERKNIDLACLFTFMDIRRLQGDVCFNVSMYDELFDSSLDEKGVDLVVEILKERLEKYNECMYVISHRKESINFTTKMDISRGSVIFLQKENGITTRTNFAKENYICS